MATITHGDSVIREAVALAPLLQEHARQGEELRTMPPHVVEPCTAAGLFTLALPKSLGGLECDPLTIIRAIEELARAGGSAGWTVLIGWELHSR
jgi:indole-3-acetate monooxygenase